MKQARSESKTLRKQELDASSPLSHASVNALADFNRQRQRMLEISGIPTPEPAIIRVGLVEDDAGLRENMVHFLKQAKDIEVVGAFPSAESAIKDLPNLKPDVILMDINLPGMNGIDCVRSIKNRLPKVQVLMVTMYEDGDMIFKALLAGASGYLLKETVSTDILQGVRDVMRGGAPLNSFIARKVVQFFQKRGPTQPSGAAVACLSDREREVLEHLAKGLAYKEIAGQLGISVETVRRHCHNIYEKMHVSSRTEAVVKYLER
jgi:DNA-binding NarL/FixJ family response regulator